MHILAAILVTFAAHAEAEVYRCQRTDGSVYYQDHDCVTKNDRQLKLLSCIPSVPQDMLEQLQDQGQQNNEHKKRKTRKKSTRKKAPRKNDSEASNRKRARAQAACSKAEAEIAQINAEYRQGYTLKRGKILEKRLAANIAKKQKYCVAE